MAQHSKPPEDEKEEGMEETAEEAAAVKDFKGKIWEEDGEPNQWW